MRSICEHPARLWQAAQYHVARGNLYVRLCVSNLFIERRTQDTSFEHDAEHPYYSQDKVEIR
jgi:hypothetical protein